MALIGNYVTCFNMIEDIVVKRSKCLKLSCSFFYYTGYQEVINNNDRYENLNFFLKIPQTGYQEVINNNDRYENLNFFLKIPQNFGNEYKAKIFRK